MAKKTKKARQRGRQDSARQPAPQRSAPTSDNTRWIRLGTATLATLIAYLLVSNGLIVGAREFQTGVFPGIVAGLLAASVLDAAIASVAGVGLGLLVSVPWFFAETPTTGARLGSALLILISAGLLGVGARVLRAKTSPHLVAGAAVLFLVVNLGVSTAIVNGVPFTERGSQTQIYDTAPRAEQLQTDRDFYVSIYHRLRDGVPYYDAVQAIFRESPVTQDDPPAVFSFRLPTAFWLWSAAPRGSQIVWIGLALATLAMGSSYWLAVQYSPSGLALLGPAAIAPYFFFAATTGVITYPEFWSLPFVLLAAAAFTVYFRGTDRRFLIAAVVAAAVAALLRELSVYVLLAAALAAVVTLRGAERRVALVAVGAGLLVFAIAFAAHYMNALPRLSEAGGAYTFWLSGGLRHLHLAIQYAQEYVHLKPGFPILLAMLGVAGAALVRDPAARLFLLVAAVGPLVGFLFVGGGGAYLQDYWGGYWGAIAVPLVFSLAPIAFASAARLLRSQAR